MKGTIDKLDSWASDGGTQIVAPSSVKVAQGWNVDEQPPNVYENWKNNRSDEKANELIDLHDMNCENDFNDSIADRCSGLPASDALLYPTSAVNRVFTTSDFIAAICRGYNRESLKECVFALSAKTADANKIAVIENAADGSISVNWVSTNVPVHSSLVPVDLCCDGSFIFLLYTNTGNYQSYLYRVALDAGAANGVSTTYDKSYIPTGHAADNAKCIGTDGAGGKRICIADALNIAFIDDANAEIVIVTKTLTSHLSGPGTLAVIPGALTTPIVEHNGLCSDGVRVWFTVSATASVTKEKNILCAVLISAPTDTTAGLSRPWSTDPPAWEKSDSGSALLYSGVTALVFDGYQIHVIVNEAHAASPSNRVHATFDLQFDLVSESFYMPRYKISAGHNNAGNHNGAACFTGRRLAIILPICAADNLLLANLWDNSNQYQAGLCLLNPARSGINEIYPGTWGEQTCVINEDHIVPLKSSAAVAPTEGYRTADACFSDNCIWSLIMGYDIGTDAVNNTLIVRVPSISERG